MQPILFGTRTFGIYTFGAFASTVTLSDISGSIITPIHNSAEQLKLINRYVF
jgi:hypothetical protein